MIRCCANPLRYERRPSLLAVIDDDLPHRLLIVCHVKITDWKLREIDLVSRKSESKAFDIAGKRLELQASHRNIAKRVNLALNWLF